MGSLNITAAAADPELLDLPWHMQLEDWPAENLAALPRGISRHVVRFAHLAGSVIAIKETCEHVARHEYHMLRKLARLDVPCVEPVAVITGRTTASRRAAGPRAGHPAPEVLPAIPRAVLPDAAPGHADPPDRRPGPAAGAPAPDRFLLGRRLPVQHARSAATPAPSPPTWWTPRPASSTRTCPPASANTTWRSPASTSPASSWTCSRAA